MSTRKRNGKCQRRTRSKRGGVLATNMNHPSIDSEPTPARPASPWWSSDTTELHVVAASGNLSEVINIVESRNKREDWHKVVNEVNDDGETPLTEAVWNGNARVVRYLLSVGSDMEHKVEGVSPLHTAVSNGYYDIAILLVNQGADVNSTDVNGMTPLSMAAYHGDLRMMSIIFLSDNVDVNHQDTIHGNTALHAPAMFGYVTTVAFLIEKGADVNYQNNAGLTPYNLALCSDDMDDDEPNPVARMIEEMQVNRVSRDIALRELSNLRSCPLNNAYELGGIYTRHRRRERDMTPSMIAGGKTVNTRKKSNGTKSTKSKKSIKNTKGKKGKKGTKSTKSKKSGKYIITKHTREQARLLGVQVKLSENKEKKIDVFKNGEKIASVGATGYGDFPTFKRTRGKKFADERRRRYKMRHERYRHNVGTPSYYADKLLW